MLNFLDGFDAAVQLDKFVESLLLMGNKRGALKPSRTWYLVKYESPEGKSFIARVIKHKVFGAVTPEWNLQRRSIDANSPRCQHVHSEFAEALRRYEVRDWKVTVLDTARSMKRAMEKKTQLIAEYNTLEPYGYNEQNGEYVIVSVPARKRFTAVATKDKLPRTKHQQVIRRANSRVGTREIAEQTGISRPAVKRILRKHKIRPNGNLSHPGPRRDLTGQPFNFLTGVKPAGFKIGGKTVWWFRCVCKRFKRAIGTDVTLGKTISCGCKHIGGHFGNNTFDRIPKDSKTVRLPEQTLNSKKSDHARN